jgi:hypothetical protein
VWHFRQALTVAACRRRASERAEALRKTEKCRVCRFIGERMTIERRRPAMQPVTVAARRSPAADALMITRVEVVVGPNSATLSTEIESKGPPDVSQSYFAGTLWPLAAKALPNALVGPPAALV